MPASSVLLLIPTTEKQCVPLRKYPQVYAFGHEGKPFYRRGPRETEAQAQQIVFRLQQRCGPVNFDYLVMLGDTADINRAFEH
jgi:hypothetical protein